MKGPYDKVLKAAGEKMWMNNRYLSIEPAHGKKNGLPDKLGVNYGNPSKTLWIKNLAYEATEDDILKVMERFGAVLPGGVRIARNFKTRQSKGFAYVEYTELESAKKAIGQQMDQAKGGSPLCILGRPCVMDYDGGRVKGSFKTSEGRLWNREYKQK